MTAVEDPAVATHPTRSSLSSETKPKLDAWGIKQVDLT
jgi:hypothetical protein